jgi:hypothetical protein
MPKKATPQRRPHPSAPLSFSIPEFGVNAYAAS